MTLVLVETYGVLVGMRVVMPKRGLIQVLSIYLQCYRLCHEDSDEDKKEKPLGFFIEA